LKLLIRKTLLPLFLKKVAQKTSSDVKSPKTLSRSLREINSSVFDIISLREKRTESDSISLRAFHPSYFFTAISRKLELHPFPQGDIINLNPFELVKLFS